MFNLSDFVVLKICVFTGLMLVVVSLGVSFSSFAVLNGTANVAVR